jgi:hypothetical protein
MGDMYWDLLEYRRQRRARRAAAIFVLIKVLILAGIVGYLVGNCQFDIIDFPWVVRYVVSCSR